MERRAEQKDEPELVQRCDAYIQALLAGQPSKAVLALDPSALTENIDDLIILLGLLQQRLPTALQEVGLEVVAMECEVQSRGIDARVLLHNAKSAKRARIDIHDPRPVAFLQQLTNFLAQFLEQNGRKRQKKERSDAERMRLREILTTTAVAVSLLLGGVAIETRKKGGRPARQESAQNKISAAYEHVVSARRHRQQEKYEDALQCYTAALELDPGNLYYLEERARTSLTFGKSLHRSKKESDQQRAEAAFEQAIADLTYVIEECSRRSQEHGIIVTMMPRYDRGRAYEGLQQYQQAEEDYRVAVDSGAITEPARAWALQALIRLYGECPDPHVRNEERRRACEEQWRALPWKPEETR
jgi:tetratricopeptide (TPR) repeat protein